MAAGDALPVCIYGANYRVTFPILDADGDLVTGATTPDTELSQDGGTFADATNEATEIATTSGIYYLDLIGTETDTDCTAIIVKTATSGAKTTPIVLYPQVLPIIEAGTAAAGDATTITFAAAASAVNDFYTGMIVMATNNTPSNWQYQARVIKGYVGSTKVATVSTWTTNPTSSSTYKIMGQAHQSGDSYARIGAPVGASISADVAAIKTDTAAILVDTGTTLDGRIPAALVSGRMDSSIGAVAANAITAAGIANGAIDAATFAAGAIDATAIADGAIDAATFAAGAINAAAIADSAIDNATFAADVGTTAYATNNIAIAVNKSIIQNNLDHLCLTTATAGIPEVVNGTIMSRVLSATADASAYDYSTDSLQALRDNTATLADQATSIWAAATADNDDAGSMGLALGTASAAGDPWATASMAATYTTAGTAGYILAHASGALSTATANTTEILTRLPDATAGAAGGLFIAGSNAATSITTGLTSNIIGNVTGAITGNITGNLTGSVGSVTTVTDKTGYALSSDGNTAAADALLSRDMSISDGGAHSSRTVLQALRLLRNKWSITGGTLTVYKEDDNASSWTGAVTTTVMNPINGVDPV